MRIDHSCKVPIEIGVKSELRKLVHSVESAIRNPQSAIRNNPQSPIYTSCLLASALCIVTSSAYSRSDPTGTPIAIRVIFGTSGFNSLAR